MHKYATIILALAFISTAVYAFTSSETLSERVERENRETLIRCLDEASRKSTTEEVLRAKNACSENILTKIVQPITNTGTASGAIVPPPPKGYTAKHTLTLTGSHDYRIYSDRKGAVWKNNNPSGLTWGISPTLKAIWEENGIEYERGTLRPINEGGNYIRFSSIEHGLRAKVISIRDRWGKATVEHFLEGINATIATKKLIENHDSAKNAIKNSLTSAGDSFWKTYDLAIPLIQKYEGLHLKAYPDYKGCSIGWGTRAKSCTEVITQAEADKRLGSIVKQLVARIQRDFPRLNEKQHAGLVSFSYNCHKGYIDILKNGLGQHKFWCRTAGGEKLQGLVNRRLEEQALIFN